MPSRPLGERPFELLFGGVATVAGALTAAGFVGSASINASLPMPVVRAWGVLQFFAGALVVAGIVLTYVRPRALALGWRLERAGLWPLAATLAVYSAVALAYSGLRAAYPAAIFAAFSVACMARARALARLERRARGSR